MNKRKREADSGLVWPFAYNSDSKLITPQEAKEGQRQDYFFQYGEKRLILRIKKCFNGRRSHFAEKVSDSIQKYVFNGMSAWHILWQCFSLPQFREVSVEDKRADIRTPSGLTIEIQKSQIDPDLVRARNKSHKSIIWILDGTELQPNDVDVQSSLVNPITNQIMLEFKLSKIKSCGVLKCQDTTVFVDFGYSDLLFSVQECVYDENKMTGIWISLPGFLNKFYDQALVSSKDITKLLAGRKSGPPDRRNTIQFMTLHQEFYQSDELQNKFWNDCDLRTVNKKYKKLSYELSEIKLFRSLECTNPDHQQTIWLRNIHSKKEFMNKLHEYSELSLEISMIRSFLSLPFHEKFNLLEHNTPRIFRTNIEWNHQSIVTIRLEWKNLKNSEATSKEYFSRLKQKYVELSSKYSRLRNQIEQHKYVIKEFRLRNQFSRTPKLMSKWNATLKEDTKQVFIMTPLQFELGGDNLIKSTELELQQIENSKEILEIKNIAEYESFSKEYSLIKHQINVCNQNIEECTNDNAITEKKEYIACVNEIRLKCGFGLIETEPVNVLSLRDFILNKFESIETLRDTLTSLQKREDSYGIRNYQLLHDSYEAFLMHNIICEECGGPSPKQNNNSKFCDECFQKKEETDRVSRPYLFPYCYSSVRNPFA